MSSLVNTQQSHSGMPDVEKKRADLMSALSSHSGSDAGTGMSHSRSPLPSPNANSPAIATPGAVTAGNSKGALDTKPIHQQPPATRNIYKPNSTSPSTPGTTAPKSTQVSYSDPNGGAKTGYLINGTTYADPEGKTPVAVGSTVTLPSGDKWYKGATGSYQVTGAPLGASGYADLSPLINASHNIGDELIRETSNYNTQQSVDQLNRAMQDAQPNYAAAIANQLLEAKQAQDSKALQNQINGDRGGIGSAQIDSIQNTSAKNREAVAQQQRQLASDTARQIADLRAQGKYEEATKLLQNNQARLSALYNEQVRLQGADNSQKTALAAMGQSYISSGVMPNADMLAAMGINEATAKMYIDRAAEQARKESLATMGQSYISSGVMPNADMLAAMGIDEATAKMYINQATQKARNESLAAMGQSYISAGVMPNTDMLAAMGIDEATAKMYINRAAEQARKESLAALGQSYISSGIMPNAEMLAAMGIDAATAKLYVDYAKSRQSSEGSNKGGTSSSDSNDDQGGNKVRPYTAIRSQAGLSPEASDMLKALSRAPSDDNSRCGQILDRISDKSITLSEGMYIAQALGYDLDHLTDYIEYQYIVEKIDLNKYTNWINALYSKYSGG